MEVIAYLSPDEQEKIKKTLDQYYSGDFRAIEGVLIAEIRELNKRVKKLCRQLWEQQNTIRDLEDLEDSDWF
jgi:hypothetical protein